MKNCLLEYKKKFSEKCRVECQKAFAFAEKDDIKIFIFTACNRNLETNNRKKMTK